MGTSHTLSFSLSTNVLSIVRSGPVQKVSIAMGKCLAFTRLGQSSLYLVPVGRDLCRSGRHTISIIVIIKRRKECGNCTI